MHQKCTEWWHKCKIGIRIRSTYFSLCCSTSTATGVSVFLHLTEFSESRITLHSLCQLTLFWTLHSLCQLTLFWNNAKTAGTPLLLSKVSLCLTRLGFYSEVRIISNLFGVGLSTACVAQPEAPWTTLEQSTSSFEYCKTGATSKWW